MNVKFKIIGFPELSQTVGSHEIEIDFDGKTVSDLITHLTATYGREAEKILLDKQGKLKSTARILHNRRQWINKDGLDSILNDGDSVILTLSVTGG